MVDQSHVARRGEIAHNTDHAPASLASDEQAVIERMRAIEHQTKPGVLLAYFNGSNWVLYDTSAQWLARR